MCHYFPGALRDVYVFNDTSSSESILCAYIAEGGNQERIEVNCTQPILGRFVSFHKSGSNDRRFRPCEVIILGYMYPAGKTFFTEKGTNKSFCLIFYHKVTDFIFIT